ncbi:hypothetical protein [Streptomyces sp. NPDC006668]|uniref:hypothetical protein n=1 Tax=Streptomyces sp. NPDC006668 TaxID=3156903 RepID=UPI00340B0A77
MTNGLLEEALNSTTSDALAAPYTLATGETVNRLADCIEGPHLQGLLAQRFGLDHNAAGEAAINVDQALVATWRASGGRQAYRIWIDCMPDVLLKCFVELAARAAGDEFSIGHALHIGRQVFTELALQLRPY